MSVHIHHAITLGIAIVLGTVPGSAGAQSPLPEADTGRQERLLVQAPTAMVVAANPLAAKTGRDILQAGGSAVDALIAVQMVLNVVEPQSSGIGGGAFIVLRDGATGHVTTYDGREMAPASATPTRFMDAQGNSQSFTEAQIGGRSVGVPGVVAALALAHKKHGTLPWAELFAPAIALAEDGFAVSPRLHALIAETPSLKSLPGTARYFYTSAGDPLPVGTILRNPALAETFRTLAKGGPDAFYSGPLAAAISTAVETAPIAPDDLTTTDLAAYRAMERPPVCAAYRVWTVCGMGPPSSGGLTVLQILGLLERTDFAIQPPRSAGAAHLIAEASRLAFADRNLFIADPDFVPVPVNGMLAPAYLDGRAALIGPQALADAEPGEPAFGWPWGKDGSLGRPGTSQVSIIDDAGTAVSMTTTIEAAFGSHIMVGGFLLNNQLTDFSFQAVDNNRLIANRVEPGKRPRSSMAPTIVLDKAGKVVLITGSPGGSAIIGYVVKAVVATLDWGMDPQSAAALPNLTNRDGPTDIEKGPDAAALATALTALGHTVRVRDLNSGVHTIQVTPDGLLGGVDPRREGLAAGY